MSLVKHGVPIAALLAAGVAWNGGAAAQKSLRDPFERPRAAAVAKTEPEAAAAAAGWKPELRAVMVDRSRSLVNIGGKIMALGEAMGGYKLIRIEERSAVLSRDGAQITLRLDKESSP